MLPGSLGLRSRSTAPRRRWCQARYSRSELVAVVAPPSRTYFARDRGRECVDRLNKPLDIQIFATDLDPQAIAAARQGRYSAGIAGDLSIGRLARYFTKEEDYYQIKNDLRGMLVFATQDILGDPPFTRLDLVSCRNLLIYLNNDFQRRVLALLHYSMNAGGLLLLGSSESVTNMEERFIALDRRWKLFRHTRAPAGSITLVDLPTPSLYRPPRIPVTVNTGAQQRAMRLLAKTTRPECPRHGRGTCPVTGRAGQYLEPAQGASASMCSRGRGGGVRHSKAARRGGSQSRTAAARDVHVNDGDYAGARRRPQVRRARYDGRVILVVEPRATSPAREQPRHAAIRQRIARRGRVRAGGVRRDFRRRSRSCRTQRRAGFQPEESVDDEALQSAKEELETSREE